MPKTINKIGLLLVVFVATLFIGAESSKAQISNNSLMSPEVTSLNMTNNGNTLIIRGNANIGTTVTIQGGAEDAVVETDADSKWSAALDINDSSVDVDGDGWVDISIVTTNSAGESSDVVKMSVNTNADVNTNAGFDINDENEVRATANVEVGVIATATVFPGIVFP